jgi:hypothetical protein
MGRMSDCGHGKRLWRRIKRWMFSMEGKFRGMRLVISGMTHCFFLYDGGKITDGGLYIYILGTTTSSCTPYAPSCIPSAKTKSQTCTYSPGTTLYTTHTNITGLPQDPTTTTPQSYSPPPQDTALNNTTMTTGPVMRIGQVPVPCPQPLGCFQDAGPGR